MYKKDELSIELAKNKADEFVVKKELEQEKNKFINLVQENWKEDFANIEYVTYNKPIKIKKPKKTRLVSFLRKISKILGF